MLPADDRAQDRGLVAERRVERALGDPGLGGDAVERDAREPVLQEQVGRDVEDPLVPGDPLVGGRTSTLVHGPTLAVMIRSRFITEEGP